MCRAELIRQKWGLGMKHEQFLDGIIKTLADWKEKTDEAERSRNYSEVMATLERFRGWASGIDSEKKKLADLMVEFSKSSLRALLLINTGGIFVIMTMLSAAVSKGTIGTEFVARIAEQSSFFVFGVAFAVSTTLLSYLAQWLYLEFPGKWYGYCPNILAMISGVASFGSFIQGAFALRCVFLCS
jgi:hypothetical protein